MSPHRTEPPALRKPRRLTWAGLGLRARLTVTFGLGALALSASMAGLTYFTARQFSMAQRQDADVSFGYANASEVLNAVRANDTDLLALTASLNSSGSRSLLVRQGQVYSDLGLNKNTIPEKMFRLVESQPTAATQRIRAPTVQS